ncbi:MAG: hypothetical protein EHM12_12525 [Dehalococcoidia bacterium]|nr:MAG: hypothetical protein EHM12_12525 [Dehalococcoidia bacterium]
MVITKEVVRDQLLAYLNRALTLRQLVDWAEDALGEGELDLQNSDLLRDIVARLGLADVREFGLSWDDCYEFLTRLGYQAQVKILPMAA